MGMSNSISNSINEWTGVGILVIIASIILIKFKSSSCPNNYTFNTSTANTCYLTSNSSVTTTTGGNIGTTIDTFVSALSEPKNWIAIVIIAIIGFAILQMYNKRKSR